MQGDVDFERRGAVLALERRSSTQPSSRCSTLDLTICHAFQPGYRGSSYFLVHIEPYLSLASSFPTCHWNLVFVL